MSERRWELWKRLSGDERIAQIYDVLLEVSELSLRELAERIHVPRTTLYPALDWLKNRGLISQKESGREVRFVAAPPHVWLHVVEETRAQAEALKHAVDVQLPGWASAYEVTHRPRVRAFEGEEGLKALRSEVFSLDGEVWEYFAVDAALKEMAKLEQGKRVQGTSRIPKGRVLMALEHAEDVPPFFDRRTCEVRWIPLQETPFAGSITFVGSRVYLLASRAEPMGLVIESGDLVAMLQTLYQAKWDTARPWLPPMGWDMS